MAVTVSCQFDFTQTASKQQEILEKLGSVAVWRDIDEDNESRRLEDRDKTYFLANILESYGHSVLKEEVHLQSNLSDKFNKKHIPVKEQAIFPTVQRKRAFKNGNLIEAWAELSSTQQQGIITVRTKKDSSEKIELICPGTFGSYHVKPRYAVFTDDERCPVEKLREAFSNLRKVEKDLEEAGARFQCGTIEFTIREYDNGKVDFHPHINVIYTNSKKNFANFKKKIHEARAGKYWKDMGEISLSDIPKVARYITKVQDVKIDESEPVYEDDPAPKDGKIISMYELAERHPDIFEKLYRQLYGQTLVMWGNELKQFKNFLETWGHDVRKIRNVDGQYKKKFYRKSNRICHEEKQERKRLKQEEAKKERQKKAEQKAKENEAIEEIKTEKARVLKAVDEINRKDKEQARCKYNSDLLTIKRGKKEASKFDDIIIVLATEYGLSVSDIRDEIKAKENVKLKASFISDVINQHYALEYDKRILQEEDRQRKEAIQAKFEKSSEDVTNRYDKRIADKKKEQADNRKAIEAEQEEQKRIEKERKKAEKSDNVIIGRMSPHKNKETGAWDCFIAVVGFEPDENKQSEKGKERWAVLQDMLEDGRQIAEGNGFDYGMMRPTMITGEDSYNFLEAIIDTYVNDEVEYTLGDFLCHVGIWKDVHYDDIDWHRVTAPTIDNIEAQKVIKTIEERHGKGVSIAAATFMYGKLKKNPLIFATPAVNSQKLDFISNDNETKEKVYYSLDETFDFTVSDKPPPIPPDRPKIAANF